jgi:hypothetical protein
MSANFIQRCVSGYAAPDEIDDYIELWHDSDSLLELHEYLGLTWEEYRMWASNKSILARIIASRSEQANADTGFVVTPAMTPA